MTPDFRNAWNAMAKEKVTMVGKTSFCKALVNANEYVELNCSALESAPNLRTVGLDTKLICFDEASVGWALAHKKVLQGPDTPVTMGDSTTGCYAYSVQLNGVYMVICSNSWYQEIETGDFTQAEIDYLDKNFEVVQCRGQLWEGPPWLDESGQLRW